MERKRLVCLVLILCLLLAGTGCVKEGAGMPEGTETTGAADTTQSTGSVTQPTDSATQPTDSATEPTDPVTEPTDSATEPTDSTTEATDSEAEPDASFDVQASYYDNDELEMSIALLPEGTVYLIDSTGYWEGTYLLDGDAVTLSFDYSSNEGALDQEGNLKLSGKEGVFCPAQGSNRWGAKLQTILSGEPAGVVQAFIGTWYNKTEDSTIVFNADGSIYQTLSVAVLEGSCRWDGKNYRLSFTLGGKTFGPYVAHINSKGYLVLDGQDGVYVPQ